MVLNKKKSSREKSIYIYIFFARVSAFRNKIYLNRSIYSSTIINPSWILSSSPPPLPKVEKSTVKFHRCPSSSPGRVHVPRDTQVRVEINSFTRELLRYPVRSTDSNVVFATSSQSVGISSYNDNTGLPSLSPFLPHSAGSKGGITTSRIRSRMGNKVWPIILMVRPRYTRPFCFSMA